MRFCVVCSIDISHRHGCAKVCTDACSRDRKALQARSRRANNPERSREIDRRRWAKREKNKERSHQYYLKNRQAQLEASKARYIAKREELLPLMRERIRQRKLDDPQYAAAIRESKKQQQRKNAAILKAVREMKLI